MIYHSHSFYSLLTNKNDGISMSESLKQEVNMKKWVFQMLAGFSGIYSSVFPTSHRHVPSVSFVCLLNFHKHLSFCTKTYCALQTFVPVLLVTPCLSSLCTPGMDTRAWRANGSRMVVLSTDELIKLHRSCVWKEVFDTWQDFLLQWLNTMQESLETNRV